MSSLRNRDVQIFPLAELKDAINEIADVSESSKKMGTKKMDKMGTGTDICRMVKPLTHHHHTYPSVTP